MKAVVVRSMLQCFYMQLESTRNRVQTATNADHTVLVLWTHYAFTIVTTSQVARLSQRDRAAGCVSFGQKWKTGTGK